MVKRSELTIFSLEPQGHVIDHALKCEKTITWIPPTKQVEKLSFLIIESLTLTRCKGIRLEWH